MKERRPGGFAGAWSHRRWRWLLGSYAVSMTGDFLYFVALIVYLLDETGSASWVAAAAVLRILAYVILGPLGGVIADRFDKIRMMVVLDIGRFALMTVIATSIWSNGPVAVVLALTVANSALSACYQPAAVSMTPLLVAEDDLAAANAAESIIAQIALFIGPGIGALVVNLSSSAAAFAVNGLTFLASAVLVLRVGRGKTFGQIGSTPAVKAAEARSEPAETAETSGSSVWHDIVDGAKTVRAHAGLVAIMILTGAILFQVGVEQVVHVLVAEDRLGMGADGVGVLSAAIGVGGLVVAPFTARLGGSRFAGLMLAASGIVFGLAMALLAVVDSTPSALAVLAVQGMGVMVFEVVFITLLQRWCREDALARVFGLNDSVTSATQLLGAIAAPLLIAGPGLNGTLWLTGGLVVVVSLAVAPALHREAVRSADELRQLEPIVVRLRDLGIFGEAPQASLERLARSVRRRHVDADTIVFREGDQPDDMFVIDGGEFVAASVTEGELNRMRLGDWFGEIGLLRSIPRTATVTAATDGKLWVIDGQVFVNALAGPERLPDPLHRTMSIRLARTHPGTMVET